MEEKSKTIDAQEMDRGEEALLNRRDFLDGLGKWSKVVIGATVFGGALLSADHEAEAWVNRGGGSAGWANRGGGSAGWANRGGSWVNRY